VSLKLTQMGLDLDTDPCRANVDRIAQVAARMDAFVRIDMEGHPRTDATLEIAREIHAAHPGVGVVLQAYLRRSAADAEMLISEGIPVRLCKGAYDEPPSVAFPHKGDVDANYVQRRLAERPANVLFMLRSVLRDRGSRRPPQGASRGGAGLSSESSTDTAGWPAVSQESGAATSEALEAAAGVPLGATPSAGDEVAGDRVEAGRGA
jgi:hypothetical protein